MLAHLLKKRETMETQIWVLSGLLTFAFTVIMALFRSWLNGQGKLLDAINDLRKTIAVQNEQLKTLFNERINMRADIKEVERRVGELETSRFKCKNYTEP